MPEGDTIFRTARSLGRWLDGREITAARSQRGGVDVGRLVGRRVTAVEARAKHLLIRFSSGHVLHSHMGMEGSWHVYPAGGKWRKPGWQARVVLEAGDRVAVCFNAPVIELLGDGATEYHPSISRLGPDVLAASLALPEVRRRASLRPLDMPVGELLLDQQVVSGIGNVYRCEALFLCRVHPWTPRAALDDRGLDELVCTASRLMRANLEPGQGFDRQFGAGRKRPWVYSRGGRPCRRCGRSVESGHLGSQARLVWWCPRCQPVRGDAGWVGPSPQSR